MKNAIAIVFSLLLSVLIVLVPSFLGVHTVELPPEKIGCFQQYPQAIQDRQTLIYKLYEGQKLVGILHDKQLLESHLQKVYQQKYADQYPNSTLHIGNQMYLVEELGNQVYTNVDDEILHYIDEHALYSLSCKAISFADETGEYARIFVQSSEIYQNALEKYLSFFVDEDTLRMGSYRQKNSNLMEYGDMITGFKINETVRISDAYAPVSQIKTDEAEVLRYLSYGDHTQLQYYTVVEGDTLESIGLQNYGLTARQLLLINPDLRLPLQPGQQVCITYFRSPINVYVYKESLRKEKIFFETSVIEDSLLAENASVIRQKGENGSKNVLYQEVWINGVIDGGQEISSVITENKQDELIAVAKGSSLSAGSGDLGYPVEHPQIICSFGCNASAESIDFINRYEKWGDVLAVDNGTIKEKSYNEELGNYVIVDHHNGTESVYGHLFVPCPLENHTQVKKGDVIGSIGMTGLATGPHVSFQLIQNHQVINACNTLMSCENIQ